VRHAPTIAIIAVWLALMGTLVRREHAARGQDASVLPAIADRGTIERDAVDWYGVYQNDRKIGWARRVEQRSATGWVMEDESRLALSMLGEPQTITTTLHAETDADYGLRRFRFALVSPAATFAASGESDGMTLEVRYGPEGRSEHLSLPLDEPVHLATSMRPRLAAAWPDAGARFTHRVLSPTTLHYEPVRVVVEGRETVDGVETLRITEETQGMASRAWIDRSGRAVREEGALGFVLRREAADVAKTGIADDARVDLTTSARIPFDGTITDSQTLDRLVLRVSGAAADHVPDAPPRQHVTGDVVRVTRESATPTGTAADADLDRYRQPSPFIESDDPGLVARAESIVGTATEPRDKVRRILDWVAAHVEREPSLTIPSARDVLRTRRGDCNEHAVLVAALVRAVGVPARVVAGVAYAGDGFYYHAWNEVWLGGWVSVDAVFQQMPVDATHVKLLDGGPERHVQLAQVLGRLAFTRVEGGT
jgi:transglutaminase-like putative cysteine protease